MSTEAVEGTVAQQGGMTDRRGRARSVQPALGPCRGVRDHEGAEPAPRGQERRADRQGTEQGRHGCLARSVAREDLQTCFIAIDGKNDPKTQKHIPGSQYTVIGTSDGGGRPHHRSPVRDQHATAGVLGPRAAGDAARRGGLPADRQDRAVHDITDRGFFAARSPTSRSSTPTRSRPSHGSRSRPCRPEASR